MIISLIIVTLVIAFGFSIIDWIDGASRWERKHK